MAQSGNPIDPSAGDARGAFRIAAVGASAGGLAPTVELLRALGPKPGVGVVIIHHLDPTHKSGLVPILSRATAMPVATAVDGARVQPNHVYVVPPNAGLLLDKGCLRVVPRREDGGLHLPIDRFFESLALDQDGLAASVVLSGSGFDGSEGTKAVKREGGITFAQDAAAEYRSMPQAAIATGCVDFVLPPAGLARELARVAAGVPSRREAPAQQEEPFLRRVLAMMQRASGVDFASYKQSTIQRRVQRRVALRGIKTFGAYAELLEHDRAEIDTLCEEVLIHVSGFFREPEAFETLRTTVLPKLCENRPGDAALRVWVPGCSAGEEAYSIAICLLEFLEATRQSLAIKIFATDLSLSIIEKARAGRYPHAIERDVSPGRLQRFFSRDEAGYRIAREVRDLCVFAKQDVTRDPPLSGMDLVSCRNLMIYLGPELQDRVIALLHCALKEPGFIIVGGSETVRGFSGFAPVDGKNKLYARTSAASRLPFDFASPRPWSGPAGLAVLTESAGAATGSPDVSDVGRVADRLVLAEFGPPGVVVTAEATNEEIQAANEEVVSSNEELRSTNEELQSAKEELQATNEELRTLNDEMGERNVEAKRLNDDLTNVLNSVEIPIVIVGRDSRVRSFTPSAGKVFGLDASNVGQPLASARLIAELATSLARMVPEVLGDRLPRDQTFRDPAGHWYHLWVRPYVTADARIDGTVLVARDVDAEIRSRTFAEGIVDTVREGLVVLDRELRVQSVNAAFAGLVRSTREELIRRRFDTIEFPPLGSPALRTWLLDLGDGSLAEGFRVESPQGPDGDRAYVLNARRIAGSDLILVAMMDATELERATDATHRAELFELLADAAEAVLMIDATGAIVFANRAAAEVFGYEPGELTRLPVDRVLPEALAGTSSPLDAKPDRDRIARHKNGAEFPVEVALNVSSQGQRPIVAFVTDLTARREAERKLAAYQDRLRRMSLDALLMEERERRRIAVALHDGIGQDLALARMAMKSAGEGLPQAARKAIDTATGLVERSIEEMRTLTFELSPAILYDLGLDAALHWLADDLQTRYRFKVEVTGDEAGDSLEEAAKTILFRVIRELLLNVLKHAKIARARVSVQRSVDRIAISVEDDGAGFDPGSMADLPGRRGFGLLSVREQLASLGGTLEIASVPQEGTLMTISLPLRTSMRPSAIDATDSANWRRPP